MVKRTGESLLCSWGAFALFLVSTACLAQVPAGAPPRGLVEGGTRNEFRAPAVERPTAIIANPALNLSAEQKAQIDRIIAAHIDEDNTLSRQFASAQQGSPARAEAQVARTKLRENLVAAMRQVLDASQRRIWDASVAEQGLRPDGTRTVRKLAEGQPSPAR